MTKGRRTEQLIEYQARFQEIQRSLQQSTKQESVYGPWLTISRQLGAGGTELAHRLAQPLGWRVYDQEIIRAIAEQTESSESIIASRDENPTGRIDGYLSFFSTSEDPGQARYLYEMKQAICTLAGEGRAIILGRGANCFLHEGIGLRLRVVAPLDVRTVRLSEREEISLQDAQERVRVNDDRQRVFVQQAYGRDIDDPLGYDLVINTSRLSMDRATTLIAAVLAHS